MVQVQRTGSALVETIESVVGAALRSVTFVDGEAYRIEYLREDVETAPTEPDTVDDLPETELRGHGRGHLEELFSAGEIECAIIRLGDTSAFHLRNPEGDGIVITYDRRPDLDIDTFLRIVQ